MLGFDVELRRDRADVGQILGIDSSEDLPSLVVWSAHPAAAVVTVGAGPAVDVAGGRPAQRGWRRVLQRVAGRSAVQLGGADHLLIEVGTPRLDPAADLGHEAGP